MKLNEKMRNLTNTKDSSAEFDPADAKENRLMAIISYISWLVLIPIFCAKDSKFARYHANQGLALALAELISGFACSVIFWITGVYALYRILRGILGIAFLLLSVFGILNANDGKAKELPVIGSLKLLK